MADLKTSITINLLGNASSKLQALSSAFNKLINLQDKLKRSTCFLNKANNEAKKSTENLTKTIKDDTDATKKNNDEKSKQKNILEDLARSVLQIGSGLGIEHKLKEIMNIGSKFEMSRLNLATVLGVDMADKQLTKFTNTFEKLAATGIGAYEDISETGYALLSAGLSKQESLVGTKIAMEVAAITRGKGEEVANVMATATKDFHLSMSRVGDILAKTQVKFQIANFTQLEEGLKYVASSASALNLPLEQTATILGTLNDAGQAGSMAGTGFGMILNQMQNVSTGLGIEIPKMKDGTLDVIKWTREVSAKVKSIPSIGNDVNKQFAVYSKMFGSEGARSFLVLQNRANELVKGFKEVKEGSRGMVNKQIQKYYHSYTYQVQALHNSFEILSNTIAKTMIPILNNLINKIKPYILSTISWIKTHKEATQKIFMLASAFSVLMVAVSALSIIKIVFAPILSLIKIIMLFTRVLRIGRIVMIVFRVTALALRLAMLALNTAFLANPIGLVIAGVVALGVGAYMLIKHWKKVKEFFVHLWDIIKKGILKAVEWFKNLFSPITKLFEKIKSWFSGDKKIEASNTVSTNVAVTSKNIDHKINHKNLANKTFNNDKPKPLKESVIKNIGKNPSNISNGLNNQGFNDKETKADNKSIFNISIEINGNGLDSNQIAELVIKKIKDQHMLSMAG